MGEQLVLDWLGAENDPELRETVLEWLSDQLAGDPYSDAVQVPRYRVSMFARNVTGTDVMVTYLVVEQFRSVQIQEIVTLGDEV